MPFKQIFSSNPADRNYVNLVWTNYTRYGISSMAQFRLPLQAWLGKGRWRTCNFVSKAWALGPAGLALVLQSL
jgi:hypothetical protein